VPGYGTITGDIAWGGNWFFLIQDQGPAVTREQIPALTHFTSAVKKALADQGITGADGGEIDHIETFGPPVDPLKADSKNFVLCPGNAYDRSPCGTGTSAKLACLYADQKLAPGQIWRQAGILDSVFEGSVSPIEGLTVTPTVTGSAWVIGESTYLFSPDDPFRYGFPSAI
jgi:4-hydroxyproline epimerase